MDEQFVKEVDIDKIKKSLIEFVDKNYSTNTFPWLHERNLNRKVWKKLFDLLAQDEYTPIHPNCILTLRILSRDKRDLDDIITEEQIILLLDKAELKNHTNGNVKIICESLKCLCNLIYNSPVAAAMCSKNQCIKHILNSLPTYTRTNTSQDVLLDTFRILFLITAICTETRREVTPYIEQLTKFLELYSKNAQNLDLSQINVLCEVLKVLFNATVELDETDQGINFMYLMQVLRHLLICKLQDEPKKLELQSHVINLLTNCPPNKLKHLIVDDKEQEHNLEAAFALLSFLETKLQSNLDIHNQEQVLTPILSLLVKCVRNERLLRKFFRLEILPPLKNVHQPPEEGDTIRNHLCRLLTTPLTNVRDLVADFLFVLCKENVGRMIKYTGYGNAAGLFAQRGLLAGQKPKENTAYSSDSESDTEEYRTHLHEINPVTGCCEKQYDDPTAHMSEEQKEYEAIKLVGLIEDLSSKGVIQPCRIGEDGKPQPLEHILQLQEGLHSKIDKPKQ